MDAWSVAILEHLCDVCSEFQALIYNYTRRSQQFYTWINNWWTQIVDKISQFY
jgi:hypothetical protein